MPDLPLDQMVKDADRVWKHSGKPTMPMKEDALDLACHVKALAAEVERLTETDEAVNQLRRLLIDHYRADWENTSGHPCEIARLVLRKKHEEIERLNKRLDTAPTKS